MCSANVANVCVKGENYGKIMLCELASQQALIGSIWPHSSCTSQATLDVGRPNHFQVSDLGYLIKFRNKIFDKKYAYPNADTNA